MTRKQKRLSIIAAGAVFLAASAALVTSALREQIVFFNSPTDVLAQPLAPGTRQELVTVLAGMVSRQIEGTS